MLVGKRLTNDAAAANLEIVDDHEASGGRTLVCRVERERLAEKKRALGHLVTLHLRPFVSGGQV